MPFPSSHLYLTLHWLNTQLPVERGQTGIRFDSPKAATQARVDALTATVQTFWTSAGNIGGDYGLLYFRLARIGPDGHYSNASSYDHVMSTSPNGVGGGSSQVPYPLQVACASTLTTSVPHGDASKGRMYLPPLPIALPSDLQWTASAANARSAAVAALLASAGPILGGPAAVFSKGSARNPLGIQRRITGVKTGRRPDVQRRRAKSVLEAYGTESAVANVPRDAGAAEDETFIPPQ